MQTQRYVTPGVYFEWLDQARVHRGWRTDIAGFVGFAPCGPLHSATRIESWTQYVTVFGGLSPFYLGYAVRGFFDNGGVECYVVRVADPDRARTAALMFLNERNELAFRLEAISPGVWVRAPQLMTVTLRPTGGRRFSLTLRWSDRRQEVWYNLRYDTPDGLARIRDTINHPTTGSSLVRVKLDAPYPAYDVGERNLADMATGRPIVTYLAGGEDGLNTVTIAHLTGDGAPPDKVWGLGALEQVDEVSIVAIPDLMYCSTAPRGKAPRRPLCDADYTEESRPAARFRELPFRTENFYLEQPPETPPGLEYDLIFEAQQQLIAHCTRLRDRVAVLDSRPGDVQPEEVIEHRRQFDSSYAALYYPWLLVRDTDANLVAVPPSGHVAGIYARCDWRVGVHKPPANEALENVYDLTAAPIDDSLHGILHEQQINVIRQVAGRGIRIIGASTVFSETDGRRFVNVRRLLTMIQEMIDETTQWMVFENNTPALWSDVEREVRTLLDGLWRRAMLDGASAEEAYSIKCDTSTMSEDDIVNGRLICEIGVHPPWPAEYVIVRMGKTSNSAPFLENGDG